MSRKLGSLGIKEEQQKFQISSPNELLNMFDGGQQVF